MKKTQENLSRNISELYKTAKLEIERKDRMIADLRRKLDDYVLRRQQVPVKRPRDDLLKSNPVKHQDYDNLNNKVMQVNCKGYSHSRDDSPLNEPTSKKIRVDESYNKHKSGHKRSRSKDRHRSSNKERHGSREKDRRNDSSRSNHKNEAKEDKKHSR